MALFGKKKNNDSKSVAKDPNNRSTSSMLKDAYALTRANRPWVIVVTILLIALVWAAGWVIGFSTGNPITFIILSLPISVLVGFFFFTRQANKAAFDSIENQLGAAASVMMGIRSGFTTEPAVNVNRQQDMVHRVIGRAGVILVGESSPEHKSTVAALKSLIHDEKKKIERFLPEVPITTLIAGTPARYPGIESEVVTLTKLQKKLKKLDKKLTKNQMRELRVRMKAIGGLNMPVPKGPMPGSMGRNMRAPRR